MPLELTPLQAEPALVLQPLLNREMPQLCQCWCACTQLLTVLCQCSLLLVTGPTLDSVVQWVLSRDKEVLFLLCKMWLLLLFAISSFISKPLKNNGLSCKCTKDTWFKCSKHWIKTINIVHHLSPQHFLYLLRKNIAVKITYPKHNNFIQDHCVLKSLLRLLEFCEDVC